MVGIKWGNTCKELTTILDIANFQWLLLLLCLSIYLSNLIIVLKDIVVDYPISIYHKQLVKAIMVPPSSCQWLIQALAWELTLNNDTRGEKHKKNGSVFFLWALPSFDVRLGPMVAFIFWGWTQYQEWQNRGIERIRVLTDIIESLDQQRTCPPYLTSSR